MQELNKEFSLIRDVYNLLGDKVSQIIIENLELSEIDTHAVHHRTKSSESFEMKVRNKNYTNPLRDMTDLLGLRIIAYVEDDVERICTLINHIFDVDKFRSVNKNDELGEDRVGYKSVHLICKLSDDRVSLPEYIRYKDLVFEIQVRTILQHSWAEIEHGKNYKFSGVLPKEIKRRLKLLSGTLELVDREFNLLSKEIDSYSKCVNEKTRFGNLDIPINSLSLIEYLNIRFAELKGKTALAPYFYGEDEQLLKELDNFGIKTIKDLDNIIPDDFINKVQFAHSELYANYIGLLRDIMIINNLDKYLSNSFESNFMIVEDMSQLLLLYKVDLSKWPAKHLEKTLDQF